MSSLLFLNTSKMILFKRLASYGAVGFLFAVQLALMPISPFRSALEVVLPENGGVEAPTLVLKDNNSNNSSKTVVKIDVDFTADTATDTDTDTTTFWLVTCDTRNTSKQYQDWYQSAHYFWEAHNRTNDIQIRNICNGVQWDGWMTKCREVRNLIQGEIQQFHGENNNIILYTDSDVLFNSFALTKEQVLQRYHKATVNPNSVLVSAESNCWLGRQCKSSDFAGFYPNVTQRSSCPQFICAGAYMGGAASVLEMINTLYSYEDLRRDDQLRTVKYHADNSHRGVIAMDYGSSVFRTLSFGLVDASVHTPLTAKGRQYLNKRWQCGPEPEYCGAFDPPISGNVGDNRHIIMDPVPGCPTEPTPFVIHFAGPNKRLTYKRIVKGLLQTGKVTSS